MSATKKIQILAFAVLLLASACNVKKTKVKTNIETEQTKTEFQIETKKDDQIKTDSSKTKISVIENADEIIIEHIIEKDSADVKTKETKRTTKKRNKVQKDLTQNKAITDAKSSESTNISDKKENSTSATKISDKQKETTQSWKPYIALLIAGIIFLFFIWKYIL